MSQTLQYLTDEHGDRTAVVLPIGDYEKLFEDLGDLAAVAERRDEPLIPHDQFIAELKRGRNAVTLLGGRRASGADILLP